jgi:hypothetical protein
MALPASRWLRGEGAPSLHAPRGWTEVEFRRVQTVSG